MQKNLSGFCNYVTFFTMFLLSYFISKNKKIMLDIARIPCYTNKALWTAMHFWRGVRVV